MCEKCGIACRNRQKKKKPDASRYDAITVTWPNELSLTMFLNAWDRKGVHGLAPGSSSNAHFPISTASVGSNDVQYQP